MLAILCSNWCLFRSFEGTPKWLTQLCLIDSFVTYTNKNGFRPVSRQQQDRFKNKLFCRLFAIFFAIFFGPAFWHTFLITQYKSRSILSMQYKSLLHVFGGWGECKSLSVEPEVTMQTSAIRPEVVAVVVPVEADVALGQLNKSKSKLVAFETKRTSFNNRHFKNSNNP